MNKISLFLNDVPWWIKNIYFIITLAFILWMMFFDQNNLITNYNTNKKLNTLLDQKAYYEEEIEKVEIIKDELFSTDANKEKFAREQYLMKKDNEDIFIIVEN